MVVMDFDKFWQLLQECLKHNSYFRTLKRGKPFKAVMSGSDIVIATPESSGEPRPIRKEKDFRRMWNLMKDDARSERYVNRNGRCDWCFNPVYICALIDYKVGDQKMQ